MISLINQICDVIPCEFASCSWGVKTTGDPVRPRDNAIATLSRKGKLFSSGSENLRNVDP